MLLALRYGGKYSARYGRQLYGWKGRTDMAEIQAVYSILSRVPPLMIQFAGEYQLSRGIQRKFTINE